MEISNFREVLKKEMLKRNMTVKQLSTLMGFHWSYVYNLFRGGSSFQEKHFNMLGDLLGFKFVIEKPDGTQYKLHKL